MDKREMKKKLMEFLIAEWMNDAFAHIKFLHFIGTDRKNVSKATIRRIEEITEDLAFKHLGILPEIWYVRGLR